MITKNQTKFIRALQQKKFRQKYNLFVAEGAKLVTALQEVSWPMENVFSTNAFELNYSSIVISNQEMQQISGLKTAPGVLAVCKIPEQQDFVALNSWIPILDDVRDPGNLGTIIRLCDWFGFNQLVCSKNTVDLYNPKVVQACMGSIAKVKVYYQDLEVLFKNSDRPILGTFMNGNTDLLHDELPNKGFIIFGNEANGISANIGSLCSEKIKIPGAEQKLAESLNVASTVSISLAQLFSKN